MRQEFKEMVEKLGEFLDQINFYSSCSDEKKFADFLALKRNLRVEQSPYPPKLAALLLKYKKVNATAIMRVLSVSESKAKEILEDLENQHNNSYQTLGSNVTPNEPDGHLTYSL